jgi:phosphatidate phosphatase APP1
MSKKFFKAKSPGVLSRLKIQLKKKLGWLDKPSIQLYRGYANRETAFVSGYVCEDKGLSKPREKDPFWRNMISMLKRYSSDELPGITVKVHFEGQTYLAETDEQGVFQLAIPIAPGFIQTKSRWLPFSAELCRQEEETGPASSRSEIFIPGSDSSVAVISDIDDTILVSHSTKTYRKLWLMLFRNARTRRPFPGVEAFYRALQQGGDGTQSHPFFYVSSSEWNLYDLLVDFCNFNRLPKGIFFLRKGVNSLFGLRKTGSGDHEHKYRAIQHLFEIYPQFKFILIGDNGQRDPDIYYRITREFPKRVEAVYIRKVSKKKFRAQGQSMLEKLEKLDVPLVYGEDSLPAARHAVRHGYISAPNLERIAQG